MNAERHTNADTHPMTSIARMWFPLAFTWLLMAAEGPLLAAIVARKSDAAINLAAWGVAYSIAVIMESPIIMLLSASTKLARNREAYLSLRRFAFALNGGLTAIMLLLLALGAMSWMVRHWVGLPEPIAALSADTLWVMLLWPASIGLRRFYQGLLITAGKTHLIAAGTVLRLATVTLTALAIHAYTDLPGAVLAGIAITAAVVVESVASRVMSDTTVKCLLSGRDIATRKPVKSVPLPLRQIVSFYTPLALTSLIALAVHPAVSFFLGHSVQPVASLAVFPVVTGFIFLFRGTFGLSFQELALSILATHPERLGHVARFAGILAGTATVLLLSVAFTPVGAWWFASVAGLSGELFAVVPVPLRLMAVMPATSVTLSFQRAVLMASGNTHPITAATAVEVAVIVLVLLGSIHFTEMVGATAGALALLTGRLCANLTLVFPVVPALAWIRASAKDKAA